MRAELKVNEVAKALSGPSFSEAQAAAWFRKLASEGVFPVAGKIGAEGGRPHHLYDPLTAPAAAIVHAIWAADTKDRSLLKAVFEGLTARAPDGDSWVAHCLACAANRETYATGGGYPALLIAYVWNPEDDTARPVVRILDHLQPHLEMDGDERVVVSISVDLSIVLRRFVK